MMRKGILFGMLVILANSCAPGPSDKVDLVKLRNGLQLASGGNVSSLTADDYNPILVQLPSNFLVLVFGSNRNGSHQIFVAKSATAYDDSGTLPKFNNPAAYTGTTSTTRIDFTAKAEGADAKIFFNDATGIWKALISNYTTPGSVKTAITNQANTTALGLKIRGIDDAGARINAATAAGVFYTFDPDLSTPPAASFIPPGVAWTAPMSLVDCGDNNGLLYLYSGYNDIGAATDTIDFGPNYFFGAALEEKNLFISHLSILQNDTSSDPPWSRVILFSAGANSAAGNGDLYVVTSHSASDFWAVTAFIGTEFADSSTPPYGDHEYSFDGPGATDYTDYGFVGFQDITVLAGTFTTASVVNFTHAGGGSALLAATNANIGTFDLAPTYSIGYSISVWIYPTNNLTKSFMFANSVNTTNTTDGFRIYRDTANKIVLETGNPSVQTLAITSAVAVAQNTTAHVVIIADTIMGQGQIYINGVLQASGAILPDHSTSGLVCVGGLGAGTCLGSGFAGSIDELKIYEDYTLAPGEVSALYNN